MNNDQTNVLSSLRAVFRVLERSNMDDPNAMNGEEFSEKVMQITKAIDWLSSLFGDKTVSDSSSKCAPSGESAFL